MASNFSSFERIFGFWAYYPQPPQYHRGWVALGEGYPDAKRFAAMRNMS